MCAMWGVCCVGVSVRGVDVLVNGVGVYGCL